MELLGHVVALLIFLSLVRQGDADALVQVGQLAQAVFQCGIFVFSRGEDASVRPECLLGACQSRVARAHFLHRIQGLAAGIFLLVDFPVAVHLGSHVCGERVDAGNAHAVQAAGHLVGSFVELAACMEHRHHDFQGRFLFFLMEIHRNAAAIVLHGDGVVLVDGHLDVVAVSGHGLVDGVVHHLVHQVVQAVLADVSDIHGGTLAHSLQAFQHLDVAGRIVVLAHYLFFFCHIVKYLFPKTEQK